MNVRSRSSRRGDGTIHITDEGEALHQVRQAPKDPLGVPFRRPVGDSGHLQLEVEREIVGHGP